MLREDESCPSLPFDELRSRLIRALSPWRRFLLCYGFKEQLFESWSIPYPVMPEGGKLIFTGILKRSSPISRSLPGWDHPGTRAALPVLDVRAPGLYHKERHLLGRSSRLPPFSSSRRPFGYFVVFRRDSNSYWASARITSAPCPPCANTELRHQAAVHLRTAVRVPVVLTCLAGSASSRLIT